MKTVLQNQKNHFPLNWIGTNLRPIKLFFITFSFFAFLFLMFLNANAQTDTEFWFAAPEISSGGGNFDKPIMLRITGGSVASTVTIQQPANPSFTTQTVTVPANSLVSFDLTTWITMIENSPANTANNWGLLINSSNPVTIYYEVVSSYCNCNPEIFVLKGSNALGTKFYTPFQNYLNNAGYSPTPYSAFDIVATQDNTTITITPTKNLVGHVAGVPYTITLQRGQTYSGVAASQSAADHPSGTKIESNRPIAVTIKDDLLDGSPYGGCADLMGDQLIPVNKVGRKYVVLKGYLNGGVEKAFVNATVDNTQISVNGTPVATINAGGVYVVTFSSASVLVEANQDIYLMHLSGFGCEVGGAVLPPLDCSGSNQVGVARSTTENFFLNILIRNGYQGNFLFNNSTGVINAGSFSVVPNTGNQWVSAQISLSTSQLAAASSAIISNSSNVFQLGIIHGGAGSGTRYGYFSNYATVNVQASTSPITCVGQNIQLSANTISGATYSWTGPNSFSSTLQNPAISSATSVNSGTYNVLASVSGCSGTSSTTTTVNPYPTVTASSNSPVLVGNTLNLSASGATSYSWTGPNSFSSTLQNPSVSNAQSNASGTYSVTGTSNGCGSTATTSVTVNTPAAALNFDGTNDYVTISPNSNIPVGNSNYTLEAWIKPTVHGNNGIIGWGNYGTTSQTNVLRLGTGNVLINYWWGNDLVVNTGSLADGNWHHVAATFDGTTRKIYVDGTLLGQDNPTGHNVPNASNLRIGAACEIYNTTGTGVCEGERFSGSMDEVRIWNRALCQGEIQNNKNCELNASGQTGLVALYHFNQGFINANNSSANTLTDAAGANTGTLTNFALNGTSSNWVAGNVSGTCSAFVAPTITASSNSTVTTGSTLNLTASSGFSTYAWTGPNGFTSTSQNPTISNVTTAASGTYTVKGRTSGDCAATATTVVSILLDKDGDGVADINDADADNDGILNTTECNKSNFYWSNPPTISGYTATGTINGIGYTYTSSQPVTTTTYMFGNSNFPASYGVPNSNPTIQNIYVTSNTLTFASPMTNPVLVFASIGQGGLRVPITFSSPVQVVWSQNVTVNSSTQITGEEGYAIVRMMGTFSSISFNYQAQENWCNFAFGADFQSCGDTDNDGTPDFLDTDSDNDGCPDAIEGSLHFAMSQTQNGMLTGSVSTSGIPVLAGAGQGIGTSEIYNTNCFCQSGIDQTAPTVITKNISVNLNASGTVTITAAQIDNGSSDACGIKTLSVSPSTFNCSNIGTDTVTLIVTDSNNNTSTATATVTVLDSVAPTITCASDVTAYSTAASCSTSVSVPSPTATDNCTLSPALVQAPFSASNSNVSLWLDATKFSTTNGGSLSGIMSDASGFSRGLTTNATFDATGFNGRPAMRYNNNQTATTGSFSTNSNTYIFTTVQLVAAGNNWASMFYHWNRDAGLTIEQNPLSPNSAPAGTAQFHFQTGNDNSNVEQNMTYGTSYIIAAKITGGNVRSFTLYKDNNGVLQNLGTTTNSSFSLPTAIGQLFLGRSDVGEFTNMRMGEFIYIQGSLPATEASIVNYLYTKWFGSTVPTITNNINNTSNASGTYPIGTTNITWTARDASGNTSTCNQSVTVLDTIKPVIGGSNGMAAPPALALSNVPEAAGYSVVYQLDIPVAADFNNNAIPYTVNNSTVSGINFNRVAYFMQLDNKWVWVSANKFTSNLTQLGIPNAATNNVAWQQTISNMNVYGSSGSGVTNATGINGNIEMWHNCYGTTLGLGGIGGNPNNYDFNDSYAGQNASCYGSFQVHNYGAQQTIFAYNRWDGGGNSDIGIGNNPSGHPDWTFAQTAGNYTTRKIYILVDASQGLQNVTVNSSSNSCTGVATYAPVVTDNCGTPTVTTSIASGSSFNVGTTPVTLTATDASGNVSTGSFNVIVVDNTAPTITCKADTVTLESNGSVSINANDLVASSSDNCSIASITASQTTFTNSNVGNNSVVVTVTDASGNISRCTTNVYVIEPAPHAICKPATVYLNSGGSASITVNDVDNGSYSLVGLSNRTVSQSTFNCSNVGTNNVWLVVISNFGKKDSCQATVTVIDGIAPNAIARNITVNLGANGTATISAAQVDTGSSDACGIASRGVTPSSFTCANVGANTVILTVTDVNGNSSTASATVTVIDAVAPTVTTQNVTVYLGANGTASLTASQVNNGSSDNCGIASVSVSPTSFGCTNVSTSTPVSQTLVSDNTWRISTTTTTSGLCNTGHWSGVSSVPAASTYTVLPTFINYATYLMPGTQGIYLVGDVKYVRKTFNLTSINNIKATLMASVDNAIQIFVNGVAVAHEGDLDGANFNDAVVSRVVLNSTGANINGGTGFQSFDNITTVNASSLFVIGTNEIVLAVANCAAPDAGTFSFKAIIEYSQINNQSATLTVTDVNGNTSSAQAQVTVLDNIAPTAIAHNVDIYLDANGAASTTTTAVNNGSYDNCSVASYSLSKTNFNCSNVGDNTDTLTVTDVNGNVSSTTATVTVHDNIAPTAIAHNVDIYLDANGAASTTTTAVNNGSYDNCSVASLSLSKTNFDCSNVGANTDTLTVTDVNGNVSSTTATVTVHDNIAPTAIAHNVDIYLDANGAASTTTTAVNNGSYDNCSIASLALSKTNFDCSNVGANTDTLTVTDVNGNVSSTTATVTVHDNIAPTAMAHNVDIYLDANGAASTTTTAVNNGSYDNCSVASYSLSKTNFDCSNVGANSDTLTVTDVNGNSSTAVATVTVHDNIAPTVNAQNVTIQLNASGTASTTASAVNNGSTDNCSIASYSLSKTSFNCSNVGANSDTLTVTDVNGNVSTGIVTITVQDNIAPTAIAQNVTVTLSGGAATVTAVQVNNGSYDNCSIATLSVSPNSFTCANIGNNTVTLTVTDVNGNVSTTTATVNVVGAIPTASIAQGVQPGFTQGGAVVLTASSPTAVAYNWTGGPATAVYNVYASGTYTVTVTNSYGCTASASTSVNYSASDLLSSYVIIGKKEAELKDHSTVYNGGVGVTATSGEAEAEFENYSNATATGTFVRARHIETENNSTVTTKILTATPTSILPAFMSNPYCNYSSCNHGHHSSCCGSSCTNTHHNSCSGGLNKNIGQNTTVTITDSVMGQVVIGRNATVTFTAARIYIKGLEIGDGANVIFTQCAVVKVCNHVNMQKNVNFNTTNNSIVTLYISKKLEVKEGSNVTANVYAMEDVKINGKSTAPTTMRGMFIGEEVEAEKYVNFYWNTNTTCTNNNYSKTAIAADESGLIKNYFDVNIYPNPALTSFNVRLFSSSNEPFTVDVYDMTGKLIESVQVSDSNLNQEMGTDYSDGMYIIKITQGENVKTSRLVKITK